MIKNIIGILLISLSLSFLGYFYLNTEKKSLNSFQVFLSNELEKKQQKNELPKDWHLIKTVKYKYQSDKSQQRLGGLPFITTNPKGLYKLDITFMDEPGSQSIVLLQFNMVNLKTNNLTYEFFLRLDLNQIK